MTVLREITIRTVLLCVLATVQTSCGVFDFESVRYIEEVIITGNAESSRQGIRVLSNAIPPQSWNQELPQEPAAIFIESFILEMTDTAKSGPNDRDDFSWIQKVTFYVESENEASTLGRHPVAFIVKPGAETRITLETNRALNLVPYILEGIRITSDLQGRVPEDDVSLIGRATLGIDAL